MTGVMTLSVSFEDAQTALQQLEVPLQETSGTVHKRQACDLQYPHS